MKEDNENMKEKFSVLRDNFNRAQAYECFEGQPVSPAYGSTTGGDELEYSEKAASERVLTGKVFRTV